MTTNRTRKQMQKIALAVLFAAAGMFVAWPAGAVVKPGAKFAGGNLTLEAKNATVGEVLETLSRTAGVDVFVTRGFQTAGERITLQIAGEPIEDAIRRILRGYNYAAIYVKEGDDFRIAALKIYPEGQQGGELVPLFAGAAVYADSARNGETRTVFVPSSRDVTIQGQLQKRGLLVPSQMTVAQESAGPLPEGLHTPWMAMQADLQTQESEQFQQLLYLQKQLEGAKSAEEQRIASQLYTDQVAKFQLQKRANVNKVEALKRLNGFQGMSSR